MTMPLAHLQGLALDCQATGAFPRGELLEVGWARSRAAVDGEPDLESHLVAPAGPVRLPRRVRELTGLTQRDLKAAAPPERVGARQRAVDLAAYDRLSVLSRELKMLVSGPDPVALRLGPTTALNRETLTRALRCL